MIRYKLDDLGWYQFEWLVHSLLKADLGDGVEAWGGRGDYGIDAYCPNALNFPSKHVANDGPFVFQAKFVENANSAGAKCCEAILNAVRKEAARIQFRAEQKVWQFPRNYVLVTNAPLEADLRGKIVGILSPALPSTQVHTLGANDLCDLLDGHKSLRRSFPQLLSLRELDAFIKEAVNAEVYEKSRAAITQARDFASAYVPTSAYHKAWKVLREHHFVVLEGPPEMGKTAIAWVIALAQLANGWQAVAADGPEDFFKCYEITTDQIFVADDAFGRTEYDPSRGSKWEAQLHRVYRHLDSKHWLLWTSRKHILERAIKIMDLQDSARSFPNPGAVLVDASHLTVEEKALILYRHARHINLESQARELVRGNAARIVDNPSFTPERIRRLVQDRLPDMVAIATLHGLKSVELLAEVKEAIENPTDRMRKAFHSLQPSHKWALISLLEADETYVRSTERVGKLYETHCPIADRRPFADLVQELSEAFVKTVPSADNLTTAVDWMHPSYRDLVIDELSADAGLQANFLASMSLEGIKLAVSSTGGSTGNRQFPLMSSPESWEWLERRSMAISSQEDPWTIARLLETLTAAVFQAKTEESNAKLRQVIGKTCEQAKTHWDAKGVALSHRELSRFCRASELVSPLPQLPDLTGSWTQVAEAFTRVLGQAKDGSTIDADDLGECVEFWEVLKENEPRFLRQRGFPEDLESEFDDLLELVEEDIKSEPILDTSDECRAESARLDSLCDAMKTLSRLTIKHSVVCEARIGELTERSLDYARRAGELEPEEPESEGEKQRSPSRGFSIDALFSDL